VPLSIPEDKKAEPKTKKHSDLKERSMVIIKNEYPVDDCAQVISEMSDYKKHTG
jgi:hypothetical protein